MLRRLLLCSAILISAVALPSTSATADQAPAKAGSSVTMVGEDPHSVGLGTSRVWHAGDESITYSIDTGVVWVQATGAPGWVDLTFAAAPGQALKPGRYDQAAEWPNQGSDSAGMQVVGDGYACGGARGRFTVHELQPDLGRLWITYVAHCGGMRPAVFGEIRIGMPAPTGLQTTPTRVGWPSEYPTVAERPVPVTVRNTSANALSTGTVRIAAGNTDFSVLSNGCPSTIQPGGECTVQVGFTPSIAGTRVGDLRVGSLDVPLDGEGTAGEAYWNMTSDPGDTAGGGQDYAFSPQNGSMISASGDRTQVHFAVAADTNNDYWGADFVAPSGGTLTPGTTYSNAQWYPGGDSSAPRLSVWGPPTYSCSTLTGEFTVIEATYDGSGSMTSVKVSFELHCNSLDPALRGTLAYQVPVPNPPPRDTTAPPAPTHVTTSYSGRTAHLTWTNPTADWAITEVRGVSGTVAPASGMGSDISSGRGTSADVVLPTTGTGYRIALVARDAAGNASTPTTVSVPGSLITLTTQPAHLVAGKTGVLSGRLTSTSGLGLSGRRVDLSRSTAGGAWVTFAHLTSSSTGTFHRTVAPTFDTKYRATFPGLPGRLGAQSTLAALTVAPAMTLTVNRLTGPPFSRFTFTTTVTPARPGAVIFLQRHKATGWANEVRTKLGPHSAASVPLFPARGTYSYRWYLPGDTHNTAGASRGQQITVR